MIMLENFEQDMNAGFIFKFQDKDGNDQHNGRASVLRDQDIPGTTLCNK